MQPQRPKPRPAPALNSKNPCPGTLKTIIFRDVEEASNVYGFVDLLGSWLPVCQTRVRGLTSISYVGFERAYMGMCQGLGISGQRQLMLKAPVSEHKVYKYC